MKFNEAVAAIGTFHDLKRTASAHVVDHQNLSEKELRQALLKVRPQYLHLETVRDSIEAVFYKEDSNTVRTLAQLMIADILLNEDGYILGAHATEESVMALEQRIVNESNETDVLSVGNKERLRDLRLYYFVLRVAWEHEDSISSDEAHLLLRLRRRLRINDWDSRVMEAKLGKFPNPNNELHTRTEVKDTRRRLHQAGLLFAIRDESGRDFDVIPEELAEVMRQVLNREMKEPNYELLLQHKLVRKKGYLQSILDKTGLTWQPSDTLQTLSLQIVRNVPPSTLLGGTSPRDGLSNEDLYEWCADLGLAVSGSKPERIERIIRHYDSLKQLAPHPDDERGAWYEVYEHLAFRDYDFLRSQQIIAKDLEVDAKFEKATGYLFEQRLNHTPLKQVGSNHPDGLLSFKDMYVMWDNKSKERPGLVNLKDHIKQFHDYMNRTDKEVPIFLVVAPGFTKESEVVAVQYTAEHFGRSIVLITAAELKALAEEWASESNKRRDEPFPLGLLGGRTGRFQRESLGEL